LEKTGTDSASVGNVAEYLCASVGSVVNSALKERG